MKQENIISIIKDLGKAVSCEVSDQDIMHCMHIAILNGYNQRPHFIIAQFLSLKDLLLVFSIKYNKANKLNKLNNGHVGFNSNIAPIYVMEHLSPCNKSLHAVTRITAKQKGYTYVWVEHYKFLLGGIMLLNI